MTRSVWYAQRLRLISWCLFGLIAALPLLVLALLGGWPALALVAGGLLAWVISPAAGGTVPGRPLHPWQAPILWQINQALARRAGLTRLPQMLLMPGRQANAAATLLQGYPTLLVTEGLLASLDRRQVTAVMAHEVAHLKHGDLTLFRWVGWLQTWYIAAGLMLVILFEIPLWLGMALVAGLPLLRWAGAALSRTREYAADLGAARLTGDPLGLASALAQITWRPLTLWEALTGVRRPSLPEPEQQVWSTHPQTSKRISRLHWLAGQLQLTPSPWPRAS